MAQCEVCGNDYDLSFEVITAGNRRTELTLPLADGRLLDFSVVNRAGTIRSTGRGLYRR
jgi:hypothetical protein